MSAASFGLRRVLKRHEICRANKNSLRFWCDLDPGPWTKFPAS